MNVLAGRVAVVTGAAGGIGFALAQAFVANGMHVVLADVDPARISAAAERLRHQARTDVVGVVTDVTSSEAVESLADRAWDQFGAVHVVCNNAGVTLPGVCWELSAAEWRSVLDVNLWGVIHGVRAFVPRIVASGDPAHIVNTASVGGLIGFGGIAPYAASKFAVVGLSESLHHDLRAHNAPVGVSVLCPGRVESDLRSNSERLLRGAPGSGPGQASRETPRIPAQRVADLTIDAIRNDRFWVHTHPGYLDVLEERQRRMATGAPPPLPPLL
jgi:NAD(P)-dependent dehydrogenase (short-subunit alcohol dehydrogenase family)